MTDPLGYTGPEDAPDDYAVVELVTSSGGQGHLFRARLQTDRSGAALEGAEVALKQFRSDAVGVERFAEMADVVQTRRHPHLARQIEAFRGPAPHPAGESPDDADLYYVANVWVPGERLDIIATGRDGADRPSLSRILTWVRQVGDALDFLHADVHDEGPVVHRDVKPANIIVTPSDDAVLIDPGIARVAAAGATGTPWGSPGFVPPETIDPSAGGASAAPDGPASDRWQLAATLVAVLLGDPPGPRAGTDALRARLVARLEPDVVAPGPLADGVLAMLAPDPADRPTSAGDWAAELGALAAAGSATPRSRGRRRALVGGTVAGVVLVAVAVGALLVTDDDAGGTDGQPERVTAVVDNRVTDGSAMREDTPGYLSTVAENFCRPNGCEVPDTEWISGDELVLTCQTVGQRATNGDDTNTNDDANPERYESRLWYYAVLEGKGEGFVSEIWLADEFRGGLDLPLC